MIKLPQRTSLVAETEQFLRQGIVDSRWKSRLPGIRRLCAELQVSAWTVRAALKSLAEQRLIRVRHGRSSDIAGRIRHKAFQRSSWKVGCVLPVPLWQMRPFMFFWFNELRAHVQSRGGELSFYASSRLYRSTSTRALAELVEENPQACWILGRSTLAMQMWFQKKKVPAIVAGSLYDSVSLPSIDTDYRAIGRHAVGRMFACGHRRIALIAARRDARGLLPGIAELERGMGESFAQMRRGAEDEFVSIHHNFCDKDDIRRAFDQMLALPRPPTAVVVSNSATLLTALTYLGHRGVTVPRSLSVIAAEAEPYYCHMVPELTHYLPSAVTFVNKMCRLIDHALDHTLSARDSVRIMPRLMVGETLIARAAKPSSEGPAAEMLN